MNFSLSLFIKKATIPFFVFITGACVLIIEITATRILAPYFGNTIFSVSSVISIVLLALSVGYFVGGKLADKNPNEKIFYILIVASGVCVIGLHLVSLIFLPTFGYQFSLIEGPVISSLLLFFLQNFLLGMLSPFAVKLQAVRHQEMGVGSVSGQIFFWSTFGSILGSLAAGFYLIPHFGINAIILSIGFVLIMLGSFALVKAPLWLKVCIFIAVAVICFLTVRDLTGSNILTTTASLYIKDGLYQRVNIYDGLYGLAPTRFLSLDRDASAAKFLESPEMTYEYTKYYAVYKLLNPNIKDALMIGGGGYSVPRALLQDLPNASIDIAEIEPTLFPLAKQYFDLPDSTKLHNVTEDGRRLLVESGKHYDYIFSDAYSSIYSTPSHLTTQEFFTIAKERLNPDGIFIANVIGSLAPKKESLALSEIKTFKSVFQNSAFFAVRNPTSQGLQNIIFVGYNSSSDLDLASTAWQAKIKAINDPIIKGLAKKQIDISNIDISQNTLLTDDFAPVEYLTAQEL